MGTSDHDKTLAAIAEPFNDEHVERIKRGIVFIRKIRQKDGLNNQQPARVFVTGNALELQTLRKWKLLINKLSNSNTDVIAEPKTPAASYYASFDGSMHWFVEKKEEDSSAIREEILKEINYQKGFLDSVMKKLSNEKFVNSAPPQVIDLERKKKADAESKIISLEERLKSIS